MARGWFKKLKSYMNASVVMERCEKCGNWAVSSIDRRCGVCGACSHRWTKNKEAPQKPPHAPSNFHEFPAHISLAWANANGHRVDATIEAVRSDLLQRSVIGMVKYRTGLDQNEADLQRWLQHAYEECLDQANYLKCAILELERQDEEDSGP